jgi:2-dehydro-3-deoxyphosphogluconate aldolase/(4S)-4-hydroxy-2-oxoglutarate aldolase
MSIIDNDAFFSITRAIPVITARSVIRSVAGPLPSMKSCPTGGIDEQLASKYLKLHNVLAVGGSWMAPDDLVAGDRLDDFRRLAERAAGL